MTTKTKIFFFSSLILALAVFTGLSVKELRYVANDAYGFGEKLEYKVGYKFITAGTGYFYILPKPVSYNGRDCYDVRFQVRSLKALEWIYRVKDEYRTLIDVSGIFPWQFEQHIREGNYSRDSKAIFDQINNFAKSEKKTISTPEYIHDIVSAFFFVRTQDLSSMKNGHVFYLRNYIDDSTYKLGVRIIRRETIEVEAGKFRTIVIQPLVNEGGLFKSEGSIYIWVSDDSRKIPVKVATKILIGYVGAELVRFSGTRGPVDAKIE
ncbi:MAG: hypothetical protein HW421_3014 [Ignavibacteria bacterium]|nr:hypothetical protein [Ignavibacteria bacterium]